MKTKKEKTIFGKVVLVSTFLLATTAFLAACDNTSEDENTDNASIDSVDVVIDDEIDSVEVIEDTLINVEDTLTEITD